MFFDGSRIVRCARCPGRRREEPSRRARQDPADAATDFVELFEIRPACRSPSACSTRRCHEFLPKTQADMEVVAKDLGVDLKEIEARAQQAA